MVFIFKNKNHSQSYLFLEFNSALKNMKKTYETKAIQFFPYGIINKSIGLGWRGQRKTSMGRTDIMNRYVKLQPKNVRGF